MDEQGYNEEENKRFVGMWSQCDTILHNRVYYMLVSQSLFVVAAVTGMQHKAIALTLCVCAVVVTILFMVTTIKLYWRSIWLMDQCRKWSGFAGYLDLRGFDRKRWGRVSRFAMDLLVPGEGKKPPPTWLDTGSLFTWGLGVLFLVLWITMGTMIVCK